jgi:transposase
VAPPRHPHPLLDAPALLADAYAAAPSVAALARQAGVSASTVLRALIRHGIKRRPRNQHRRPRSAHLLDDATWLADRYRTRTGVEIAEELGVSTTTVYAAMARNQIPRRTTSSTLSLSRPGLADPTWLRSAVQRDSSGSIAAELDVSAGAVTDAYRRAGIDPAVTPRLYARGKPRQRPPAAVLQTAWDAEGSYRGVARRIGVAHPTAAVWLAEIGVYADETPAISRASLESAINNSWSLNRIATEHRVAVTTVRIELHRHELFNAHRTRHRR